MRYVWESSRKWAVINAILTILQGFIPLVIIYLMKLLVDDVTAAINAADKAEAFKNVLFIIVITGIASIINSICISIGNLAKEYQTQLTGDYMYDILHRKSTALELEYYENSEYHDKFQRAKDEAPYRPITIVNGLTEILRSTVSLLLIAGMLSFIHWSIAVILFFTIIPEILIRMKYSTKIYKWMRERTVKYRTSYYFHRILIDVDFAKELRLFSLKNLFINKFKNLRAQLRNERVKIIRKRTLLEISTQTFSSIAIFGIYGFIVYRAINGFMTIGDLVMYFMAFQRGLGILKELLTGMASLYESNLFLSNINEFLKIKSNITEAEKPVPFPKLLQKGISVENISFKYPNSQRKALNNTNLFIPAGKTIALVGENGSGKTTLVKLLCRLYDINEGKIAFDGTDIREFKTEELRKHISVVFQDFVLYNQTAEENIWFGNADEPVNKSKIAEAAGNAGVHELLKNLPKGYDTTLGKLFKDSEELSIGEWQKIAIARAFYRDSPIIILDEPTSSMDAKTEYEVFEKFKHLTKGKTSIIVSHRFSTVKMADYIYVLDKENIIEHGTHNELMRLNGKYAGMFNLQASNYDI